MPSLVDQCFALNLKILRFCGLHNPKKNSVKYRLYSYFIFLLMITPVSVLSCSYLFIKDLDLEQITDNAFLAFQMTSKLVKFLPFIINYEAIRRNIYMLESPLFTKYKTREEIQLMDDCIRICRRNCRFFLFFCVFSIIGIAITPLLKNGRHLPLEIWLPFNFKEEPKVFYLIYVYVIMGVSCGGLSNGAMDPLVSGMTFYAVTQLKMLKHNLEHLDEYAENIILKLNLIENKNFVKARMIYNKIKTCIDHHQAILNFIKNYEKTFSPVIFSQFAASVLVICVCCLYLSTVEPFTVMFCSMSIFLITMLVEIYLYCYYGTILNEENNSLINAAYMGNWYEYDIKSKKILIVLMERSKRPMSVTAGKILDSSLITFTTILRRAYSLLAVLKNY